MIHDPQAGPTVKHVGFDITDTLFAGLGNALDAASNGVVLFVQLRSDIQAVFTDTCAKSQPIASTPQGISRLTATATGSLVTMAFNVTNIVKLGADWRQRLHLRRQGQFLLTITKIILLLGISETKQFYALADELDQNI